ncbi:MAG: YidC/Oxa1 family membrane protein insertase [Bacillota bacterium]
MFGELVKGMTWLINWLYDATVAMGVPSYALAIIFLTVLVKLVLYPLTHMQMKSMVGLQRLQPEIKKIQAKYGKKDPQKMQQAIMELYREHKVNPMAGCFLLLVQLPILIALYRALYRFPYTDVAHAGFFWISTLSDKDPYYILPVLAGVTTYIQSKMTMVSGGGQEPTQRMMTVFMPVFIAWIASTIAAGLSLYWVVFNVLSIAQQYIINRQIVPAKEGVGKGEGGGKER